MKCISLKKIQTLKLNISILHGCIHNPLSMDTQLLTYFWVSHQNAANIGAKIFIVESFGTHKSEAITLGHFRESLE